MDNMNVENLIRKCDQAFNSTERTNQRETWELIAEFMLPNQSGIFNGSDTPGGKKTRRLYDSTAIQANHDLSSAIHATLTNPATKWSKLRFKSEMLNNSAETVRWLDAVNKYIHTYLNESNFDTQVAKNYQALSGLGTMVLFHEEVNNSAGLFEGYRFEAIHLSEVAYSENAKGLVDVIYRKFKLTNRQLMERWPDKLPEEIVREASAFPDKEKELIFAICPRDKNKVKVSEGLISEKQRPYAAYYILRQGNVLLQETGYYEFPVYVTRWQTMPSELYGRGPGHIALPDVRTLNRVKELGLHAINKAINPPMIATQRGILGSLDLRPGQLTIVRDMEGLKELPTQARFDVTQFAVEDLRNAIKSIFFIDKLFLPPRTETGEMTAFEIDQRLAQMQRVLGPTLSRLNNEFLSPLIIRCFKILLRAGVLPPLPEVLRQQGIDVEIGFVNQLSRAQQIEELQGVQQWMRTVAEVSQFKPEVLDYVNADEYAKFAAKIHSIPEQIVTNDDQVAEIRQQRAEQMQQQQAIEQGVGMADIAAKTGLTDKGGKQ